MNTLTPSQQRVIDAVHEPRIEEGASFFVVVTLQDIEDGAISSCYTCPVARAINRVLPKGLQSYVEDHEIRVGPISEELTKWRTLTPDVVIDFIEDFDSRQPVAPFFFILTGFKRKN